MAMRGGYPIHDAEAPHCLCWSCENTRRVTAAKLREEEFRARALAAAADLVVIHVMKDVFELQLGDRITNGKLAQILNDAEPYERPVVDVFLGLPALERYEVLQAARAKRRIRVAT
jgi:hypothetical protein